MAGHPLQRGFSLRGDHLQSGNPREQEWFAGNRDELAELVRLLPRHNSDHASLARHVGVYTVELSDEGDLAETVSVVAIYQTLLDGQNSHLEAGATRLIVHGKVL